MKASTRIAVIIIFICAVGLGIWFARPKHLTDQQHINAQIQAALSGANRHSIGAIMSVISTSYTDDNGLNADQLRFMIGHYYSSGSNVDVSMNTPIIVIHGDDATSDSTLVVRDANHGDKILFAHPVHLKWHKEASLTMLMFPDKTWRVVSSSYGEAPGMQ